MFGWTVLNTRYVLQHMSNLLFGVFVQTEDSSLKYDYTFMKMQQIFFFFFFFLQHYYLFLCLLCVRYHADVRQTPFTPAFTLGWQKPWNHNHVRVLFSFSCIFKCLWFSFLLACTVYTFSGFFWETERRRKKREFSMRLQLYFFGIIVFDFILKRRCRKIWASALLRWHMPKLIKE